MPPKRAPKGREEITDLEFGSDLDEFGPVQAAAELKRVIEGHKKRRYAIRKKIEARYDSRVAEIIKRTEKRLAEEEKKLTERQEEQLARLVEAAQTRDTQQRAAADKVARFYDGCMNLADLLASVYSGLAAEARSAELEPALTGAGA